MAASSLDLIGTFINNFDTADIYAAGWYAAQQWVGIISGTLIALAIGIRNVEDKVAALKTGQYRLADTATTVVIVALAMGLYFLLAHLIIQFMNAIYASLDHTDSMRVMSAQLDEIRGSVFEKQYEFSLSEIADSLYMVLGAFAYAITFCTLILLMLFSRIAHAILVSFCLFWGAVALPMSITNGMKLLKGWKVVCLTALFWPIIESFFLYLLSTSINAMLSRAELGLDDLESWNMGILLFYFAIFAIINLLISAFVISAPIIATGIANGSGGITGMVGSFGTAALGAGVIAGSYLTKGFNKAGGAVGGKGRDLFQNAYSRLRPQKQEMNTPQKNRNPNTQQQTSGWGVGYGNASLTLGPGFSPGGIAGNTPPSAPVPAGNNQPPKSPNPKTNKSVSTGSGTSQKQKSQARRGAIINQQRKKP